MIKWFKQHNKISWSITILIAIIIFYTSNASFSQLKEVYAISWISVAYHFLAFFSLSLFFFISLIKKYDKKLFIFSILILFSYAILDEIHQFFVPGRFCSLGDLGFDSIGILLAFIIYFVYLKKDSFNIAKTLKKYFTFLK